MRPTVYIPRAVASALLALAVTAPAAHAQRVETRADLATLLGATARTETFDDVTDPARGVYATSLYENGVGVPLTSASVLPNRGAGLIEPGIAFSNGNNGHWFWPAGWGSFGNTTTVYAGSHSTQDLTFTSPTRAFGVDLYVFWWMSVPATISVFDVGGQLVGSTTLTPTRGEFFGWQHEAGIGRVRFQGGTNDAVGMRMDNVTFGAGAAPVTTAPEPATFALLAGGLAMVGGVAARRRRREG